MPRLRASSTLSIPVFTPVHQHFQNALENIWSATARFLLQLCEMSKIAAHAREATSYSAPSFVPQSQIYRGLRYQLAFACGGPLRPESSALPQPRQQGNGLARPTPCPADFPPAADTPHVPAPSVAMSGPASPGPILRRPA